MQSGASRVRESERRGGKGRKAESGKEQALKLPTVTDPPSA